MKRTGVLITMLLLIPVASTAQIGLIDTFISGPTTACVDQSVTYRPGPDACNSVYWKVIYNDTQLALGVQKVICADGSSYYAYTAYAPSLVEVGAQQFAGRCGGLDFLSSTSSLPVKFKRTGKYKIETEPYGKKNGYPSACQNATKTVYVGSQAVGNISGPASIRCSGTGPTVYSIPPVPGTSRYEWSLSNGLMQFGLPSLSNGGATVTYPVNSTTGATSGTTLTVTVYPACAGEAVVTRTLTLYRSTVQASVTQGLPPGVCYGNRYPVRAMDGNDFRWVANFLSNTGMVLRSDTYYGASTTISIPFDTRVVAVNYAVYYTNLCNGQNGQTGGGTYVTSTGCTPGARLAAQPEEAVAPGAHPNPVADVLTIHVPEADRDGGFTARLHDGLQRVALAGNTKSSTLRMDVRRLPPGMYLLRTVRPSGTVTTRKVLVMH